MARVAVVGRSTYLKLRPGAYVIRGMPPYGPLLEATCDVPENAAATVDVLLEPVPDSGPFIPEPVSDEPPPGALVTSLAVYAPGFVNWLAKVFPFQDRATSEQSASGWQATVVRARRGGRPRELSGPHPVGASGKALREVHTGTAPTYLRLTGPPHPHQDDAAPRSNRYVALPAMTRARLVVLLVTADAVTEGSVRPSEAVARVRLADPDADALLAHLAAHRPVRAAQIADRLKKPQDLFRTEDAAAACLFGYFMWNRGLGADAPLWTAELAERFAEVPDALVIHAAALAARQGPDSARVRALLLRAADPYLGLPRFTQGLRLLVSALEDLVAHDDVEGRVHEPTADALKTAMAHLVAVDPDHFLATYDGRSSLAPPGLPDDWSPSSALEPAEGAAPLPFAGYVAEALRQLPTDVTPLADGVGQAGSASVRMQVHGAGSGVQKVVLTVSRNRGNAWRPVPDLAIVYSAAEASMGIAVTDTRGAAVFDLALGSRNSSGGDVHGAPRGQEFSLVATRHVRHVPLVRVPEPAFVLAAETAERVRLRRRVRIEGITLDLREYDDRSTGIPTLRVEAHTSATHTPQAAEGAPYGWASFLARPAVASDAPHELYVVPLVPRAGGQWSGALNMGPSSDGLDWYVSPFVTDFVEKDVAARSLARASDPRTAQALRSAAHE
ncbi:hypothetical protein OG427_07325 [Streptomyces sp. NBC_00133]|uniref:hypothetical protein n=1 Tax=Streptomyces sp. NBC_00133 TaxID=2903624 RepID=UPI003253BB30